MAQSNKKSSDYKERPFADAAATDGYYESVEDRQPDQIADYHETHPTLKPGKAHKVDPPVLTPGDPVE